MTCLMQRRKPEKWRRRVAPMNLTHSQTSGVKKDMIRCVIGCVATGQERGIIACGAFAPSHSPLPKQLEVPPPHPW
eukprot:208650-Amphidinium_carterae.1